MVNCAAVYPLEFLGLFNIGLSEGGPLTSDPLVWVVSAEKLQPLFSSPALCSLHESRPSRLLWVSQIYRPFSPSLSLSRPHLASDGAHALYHGYACLESTSASLRPKHPSFLVRSTFQTKMRRFCNDFEHATFISHI